MNNNLVKEISLSQIKKDIPQFNSGDTLKVSVRIRENGKERVQLFQGIVVSRRGSGISESFIIRKMSGSVGVERTFFINSPVLTNIEVLKIGKVRRHKIFYIRERSGKSARIKEVL